MLSHYLYYRNDQDHAFLKSSLPFVENLNLIELLFKNLWYQFLF